MSATQEDAIRNFCQQKGITEEELGRKISEGIQKYMPPFPIDTYKKGYQDAIDKACEWLFEYNKHQARKFGAKSMMRLPDYTINVGDFRKAMEERK